MHTHEASRYDDEDTDHIDITAIRRALGEDQIITEGREPRPRPRGLASRVPMIVGTLRPAPTRHLTPPADPSPHAARPATTALFLVLTAGVMAVALLGAWL